MMRCHARLQAAAVAQSLRRGLPAADGGRGDGCVRLLAGITRAQLAAAFSCGKGPCAGHAQSRPRGINKPRVILCERGWTGGRARGLFCALTMFSAQRSGSMTKRASNLLPALAGSRPGLCLSLYRRAGWRSGGNSGLEREAAVQLAIDHGRWGGSSLAAASGDIGPDDLVPTAASPGHGPAEGVNAAQMKAQRSTGPAGFDKKPPSLRALRRDKGADLAKKNARNHNPYYRTWR